MKHNMGSSERLIELVKERPAIWNTRRGNTYLNKVQREEAWTEIAVQWIGDDWYGMPTEGKCKNISSLKSRWKNIRDNFKKSNIRYNQKEARRKCYYADLLTFLLEVENFETEQSFPEQREDPLASSFLGLGESNSESGSKRCRMATPDDVETTPYIKIENWSSDIPDEVDEESRTSKVFEPIVETQTAAVHTTTVETQIGAHPPTAKPHTAVSAERPKPERCNTNKEKPQNGPDEFEKELLNVLKTKMETPRTSSSPAILSDPDAMFFLSQLPYIKSLSSTDRLDFRIKFMQLLQSCINNKTESRNTSNETIK